ncbi:hypothetical protein V5O48_016736 [Marasmius crinis-equi]|uniref:CxC2-like cysteine cluster KDZ transposase-associated domain-containing protein n=1 Tax=Marasmius crinis-equi TaxID=585013 RepID=A0ABR3EQX7_9AGAR
MSKRPRTQHQSSSKKKARNHGQASVYHHSVASFGFPSSFNVALPSPSTSALPSPVPWIRQQGDAPFNWKDLGDDLRRSGATWQSLVVENVSQEEKTDVLVKEEDEDEPMEARHSSEHTQDMPDTEAENGKKRKKKRSVVSRHPNIEWKEKYRPLFLQELMRLKGRSDSRKQMRCSDCKGLSENGEEEKGRMPTYRCRYCNMGDMVCEECCVRRHWDMPWHFVERWDGQRFTKTDLADLGLKLQLNHFRGVCTASKPAYDRLLVLHTNGIHRANIRFCECPKSIPQYQQLLRRRLYPANLRKGRIATVVTFECLEMLHAMTLTTKGSVYDFYRGLEQLTDATGMSLPKSRYKQLLRVSRQWRHLTMLMRSGYGMSNCHDIDDQPEGVLTLRCPTCPHPGRNIDDVWWKRAWGKNWFLYRVCVCVDANFRLKEQLVSSHSRDPALCDGLGYFARRRPFEAWVEDNDRKADPEDEISSCVPLAAVSKQQTKFSKGLRYTGVGGIACARTDMIMRVVNLNKGERYSVMDYLVGLALQAFSGLYWVLLCYDIACQWFRKLDFRAAQWPEAVQRPNDLSMTPAIGKLHEPGHKQVDHQKFSLNLIRGVGYTDGESLERIWAAHNALSNSTKTMGPGARQDLLEIMFDFWNWLKYTTLGPSLYRRWRAAVNDRTKQTRAHKNLTSNLEKAMVEEWEEVVKKWEETEWAEEDGTLVNPYELKDELYSQARALEELALEDEARERRGQVAYHRMSAASFVATSLDIVHGQEKLKQKIEEQKREPTLRQSNQLQESRKALRRRIVGLLDVRAVYMPGLPQYLVDKKLSDDYDDVPAEEAKVWLPSSIPKSDLKRVCGEDVVMAETKLQFARANDALDGLRHTLRVKARMVLFKNSNVRGQRDSGRAREVIDRVQLRAERFVKQYRMAREAYYGIVSPGEELGDLPKLENGDVRALSDPDRVKRGPGRRGTREDDLYEEVDEERQVGREEPIDLIPPDRREYEHRTKHGTGETRKSNSWIWEYGRGRSKVGLDDGADDDNELLRAEWCKSRARVMRAKEEVMMLQEEMQRGLRYLDWAAARWDELAGLEDLTVSGGTREGRRAYAHSQAAVQRGLRDSFQRQWKSALQDDGENEVDDDGDDGDEGAEEEHDRAGDRWDESDLVKEEEEEASRLAGGVDIDDEVDEDEEEYVDEE